MKEEQPSPAGVHPEAFSSSNAQSLSDDALGGDITSGFASSSSQPRFAHRSGFHNGEVIAGRFVVVRFIGRGGMGEVYEVEDLHLHNTRIALKRLLPHVAEDPAMQQTLEREVMLARSVTHPNLCPIYDIFRSPDPGQLLLFMTMKLLPGETLTARLQRPAKLTATEVELILREIAAGLAAAHRAGIIHRDVKTSNILVDGAGTDIHIWITDFGLARAHGGETTVVNRPMVAGTPGYIAPELYLGRQASVVTDVFAFGVVAQQVIAAADCPAAPAWRRLLDGCLEPDPDRRFKTIDEALAALEGGKEIGHALPPGAITRRKAIALGAGAAAAVGAGIWFGVERSRSTGLPLPSRRFVALLAWPQTQSGDLPVVTTLLDSIGNRLARAEAYVSNLLIISSPDLHTAPNYAATPASVVSAVGANLVLAASLTHTSSLVTLTLQVLEAETSQVLRKTHTSVAAKKIGELTDKAAAMAAAMLDLPRETSLADPDELDQAPASTYRLYSEAKALVEQPNDTGLDAGIAKYQQLVNDDPHFALGYARLSLAYTHQYLLHHEKGSLDLAASNAALALQYNPHSALGLRSKALALLYSGSTGQALDYLSQALQADPENPETLLYKAQALEYLNRGKDAELTFRQILKSRPNYWPAHNELGWILFRQARYNEAAQAFEDASVIAPQVALPLANLGTIYAATGKTQEAVDALTKSLQRGPNYVAWLTLGDLAFMARDYNKALANYSRARDLKPEGDIPWRDLGDTYAMLNKPEQVKTSYANAERLLAAVLQQNPNNGSNWMTLAFYQAKLGDTAAAQESLRNAELHGAPDVESQLTRAQALALLGRKEDALKIVLACLKNGISPAQINLALDLKDVRLDPRYKSAVAGLHPSL